MVCDPRKCVDMLDYCLLLSLCRELLLWSFTTEDWGPVHRLACRDSNSGRNPTRYENAQLTKVESSLRVCKMLSLLVQTSQGLAAFHLLWFAAFTSQHIQCHLHHPHKPLRLHPLRLWAWECFTTRHSWSFSKKQDPRSRHGSECYTFTYSGHGSECYTFTYSGHSLGPVSLKNL